MCGWVVRPTVEFNLDDVKKTRKQETRKHANTMQAEAEEEGGNSSGGSLPSIAKDWKRPRNLPSNSKPVFVKTPKNQKFGVFGFARADVMTVLERGAIQFQMDADAAGGAENVLVDPRWGFVPLGAVSSSAKVKSIADAASKKAPRGVAIGKVEIGKWILMSPRDDSRGSGGDRVLGRLWARLDLQRKQRLDKFEARQMEIEEFRVKQRTEIQQRLADRRDGKFIEEEEEEKEKGEEEEEEKEEKEEEKKDQELGEEEELEC